MSYSPMKGPWWIRQDNGLPAVPKQVQFIISDLCNQDCSFCAYRMSGYTSNENFMGDSKPAATGHNNPVRFVDNDRAITLLEEMAEAGVLGIQFTGGGEPTVHPVADTIFSKALDLGLKCALVSNGVKWSGRLINDILPRFDWIRVSIDAGSAETYAAIRRCPETHWERVWSNLSDLRGALDSRPSPRAVVGLGFVVTPENYRDIMAFSQRAYEEPAVDNVRFSAMFSPEGARPYLDIHDDIVAAIAEAKERYDGTRQTYGLAIHDNFGERLEDLELGNPDYKQCGYQYMTSYIGGDLKAYRCCVYSYSGRGEIDGGNLKTRSFGEFWASADRVNDFAAFDARGCKRCQFNEKNRAINYMLDEDPEHIQWP